MPSWDTSELDALAVDLSLASTKLIPAMVPVINKAGVNIKRVMKADASGHRRLAALPRYVEYDVTTHPTSVEVEVGFRKEGQGNLAAIAAFGTPKTAPVMDITRGLTEELPNFMRWAAKAAGEAML